MSAVDTLVEPVAWAYEAEIVGGHWGTFIDFHKPIGRGVRHVEPLFAASALEASEAKIAALTAERDALREAVEAVDQHERSNFIGDPLDKARRASWRGVMRKVRAALRQEGKP